MSEETPLHDYRITFRVSTGKSDTLREHKVRAHEHKIQRSQLGGIATMELLRDGETVGEFRSVQGWSREPVSSLDIDNLLDGM